MCTEGEVDEVHMRLHGGPDVSIFHFVAVDNFRVCCSQKIFDEVKYPG